MHGSIAAARHQRAAPLAHRCGGELGRLHRTASDEFADGEARVSDRSREVPSHATRPPPTGSWVDQQCNVGDHPTLVGNDAAATHRRDEVVIISQPGRAPTRVVAAR
jgi:hypothetical protein